MKWGKGLETTLRSFVNIITAPKGGTHIQGFERAITKTFNEALRSGKTLKNNEPDDMMEGLTAVITVRLSEPQFERQAKEVLGIVAATRIISGVVAGAMTVFF